MKAAILFLLFLFSGAAQAQAALPDCIPGLRGHTVSVPVHQAVGIYQHVVWFCTDAQRAAWSAGVTINCGSTTLAAPDRALCDARAAWLTSNRVQWHANIRKKVLP